MNTTTERTNNPNLAHWKQGYTVSIFYTQTLETLTYTPSFADRAKPGWIARGTCASGDFSNLNLVMIYWIRSFRLSWKRRYIFACTKQLFLQENVLLRFHKFLPSNVGHVDSETNTTTDRTNNRPKLAHWKEMDVLSVQLLFSTRRLWTLWRIPHPLLTRWSQAELPEEPVSRVTSQIWTWSRF